MKVMFTKWSKYLLACSNSFTVN